MMGFQNTERNQRPASLWSPFECTALIARNHFDSCMKAKSYNMLLLPVAQLHRYFFGRTRI